MANPRDHDEEKRELGRAAVANARDLYADAAILLEHERWARAHVLAVFAIEEIGKAQLAVQSLELEPGQALKVATNHQSKLIQARQILAMVDSLIRTGVVDTEARFSEEHDDLALYDHDMRMAGLYVDVEYDGRIAGGTDSVDRARALATVGLARAAVTVGEMLILRSIEEQQ